MVLGVVHRLHQVVQPVLFHLARVVAGGDAVGTQFQRVVQKGLELDFGIAQHVRIGGAASRVFLEEVREHAVLVFLGEIDDFHVDADDVGHAHGIQCILLDGAVFVVVVVFPVLHEYADDFMALLLEQPGGYRRIHTAGHADDNTFLTRHGENPSFQRARGTTTGGSPNELNQLSTTHSWPVSCSVIWLAKCWVTSQRVRRTMGSTR